MKRTYASGAEKCKISENKRKALFSLPKVTSFFGPASVTLPVTAATEPPSQDASQNTDYLSSTQTAGSNDDQTLVEQEHDNEVPTAETGEGDAREKAPFTETDPGCWPEHIADDQRIDIVRSGPVQIEEFNFPQSQSHRHFTKDRYFMKMKNGEKIRSQVMVSVLKIIRFSLLFLLYLIWQADE